MRTGWAPAPRCRCGAAVVTITPVDGSFAKLRNRLSTSPAFWVESVDGRLLVVDAETYGPLPLVVHLARHPKAGALAFLGPWLGERYEIDAVPLYTFDPAQIPGELVALLARLGVTVPPIVTPSLSTVAAIHALPAAEPASSAPTTEEVRS